MRKACGRALIIALAFGIAACSEKTPTGLDTPIGLPQPTTGTIIVSTTTTRTAGFDVEPGGLLTTHRY